ncbi:response regulator [Halocola ammonii]
MECTYKHILIIDDDRINCLLNRQFVSFCLPKVMVNSFQDATLVLQYLKEGKVAEPDLILLDINMPEMNGWEFLTQLKTIPINPDVIMLSSSLHFADIEKSTQFDAVKYYIEKPLTEEKIERFICQKRYEPFGLDRHF